MKKELVFSVTLFFFVVIVSNAQSQKKVDQFGTVTSDSKFAIYPDVDGKLKVIRPDSTNFPSIQTKLDPDVLVVIDGDILVTGLKQINPKIIKSLAVLKSTEAKKIYGGLGEKGALLITTK